MLYLTNRHFPWSVLLSTIEMTSICSKFKRNHEPQTSGVTLQSFEHFDFSGR